MNSISEEDPSEAVLENFVLLSALLVENIGSVNDDEKNAIWSYLIPVVSHYVEIPSAKLERYTLEWDDGGATQCCVVEGKKFLCWDSRVVKIPSDACFCAIREWRLGLIYDFFVDMTGELYFLKHFDDKPRLTRWNEVTETFETVLAGNVLDSVDAGKYPDINVHNGHMIFVRQEFRSSSKVKVEVMLINLDTKVVVRRELLDDLSAPEALLLRANLCVINADDPHIQRIHNVFTGERVHLHPSLNQLLDSWMGDVGREPSLSTILDINGRVVIADHRLNRVYPVSMAFCEDSAPLVRDAAGRLLGLSEEVEVHLKPLHAHGHADKSLPFILNRA